MLQAVADAAARHLNPMNLLQHQCQIKWIVVYQSWEVLCDLHSEVRPPHAEQCTRMEANLSFC